MSKYQKARIAKFCTPLCSSEAPDNFFAIGTTNSREGGSSASRKRSSKKENEILEIENILLGSLEISLCKSFNSQV